MDQSSITARQNISGIILTALLVLTGCSGGGGGSDPAPASSQAVAAPDPDILTATPQGLLRGKASGQGQQLVFSRPNLHQQAFSGDIFLANGLVYYPREAPPILFDYPNQDIWSVRTDGTQDHAVLNTTADEFVKEAQGALAIYEQGHYSLTQGLRTEFGSLANGAPLTTLLITEPFTQYRFLFGARAFFNNQQQIFSVNANGSSLSTHATASASTGLAASDVFGNTLIYRESSFETGTATLKSVPISGGGASSLDDGLSYVSYAGHVGSRVVSHRCTIDSSDLPPRAGPCDVVSVDANGSGPAVLASHAANEAVQGIIGNQVIIRRNLSGNDQLVAVPVAGGPERLIMTMTDSEFVQLVIGDRLLVRRPSGSWMLDLNGTLTQFGNIAGDSGFIAVGNAVCLNKGAAAWCMPLDGQGPAVKIADTGKVIGAL